MTDNLDENSFTTVKFTGDRFDGGNLPVELLDNIKSYQEILLVLAEEIWRERNPSRVRLPKNFKKSLSLSFSHVEDGSAKAVLKTDSSAPELALNDDDVISYMAMAQTRFLSIASAANENRPITGVPTKITPYLKELLGNLREGERVEVVSNTRFDKQRRSIRYSQKTRDKLIARAKDKSFKKIAGLGIVKSILDSSEQIEILSEHGSFKFPVSRKEIREERFPIASFVEFNVDAQLRANGLIKSIREANSIERLDGGSEHQRYQNRLKHLSTLRKGWKNGDGKKMSQEAIVHAHDLGGFVCSVYEQVSLFPQVDGSINIEFEHNNIDVIIACRSDYIRLETFDESDGDPVSRAFFGLSASLLRSLIDLEDFSA